MSADMPPVVRCLAAYSRATEKLAKQYTLFRVDLSAIRAALGLREDDPLYDAYQIKPKHASLFQPMISEPLDFERFDYFLEAEEASPEGRG